MKETIRKIIKWIRHSVKDKINKITLTLSINILTILIQMFMLIFLIKKIYLLRILWTLVVIHVEIEKISKMVAAFVTIINSLTWCRVMTRIQLIIQIKMKIMWKLVKIIPE